MADNITIKDASAANVVVRTTDDTGVHTPHQIIASSALPTGAATSANQSTQITAEQAIQAAVEAIDAGKLEEATFTGRLGEVQASPTANTVLARLKDLLSLIVLAAGDNNIGNVDVASIAAGDNNIGNVDLASAIPAGTNNIGDVDVLSLPALPAGTNNIGDVDVASSALPTGASTATNQTTIIGHLDGVEGLLTTIDADTGTLAGAVSGTEMQVDVVGALPAGTNAIGKLAANSGVDIGDVDVTSISAGSNLIGDVGIQARASGGLSIARDLDLDETELEIKASAGQLFGWYLYNDGAADVSVKLYNATAANVTVGTTTPVMTLTLPAGSAANLLSPIGIVFDTGICAAAVTEVADNGTTAPAANQVVANFFYK